MPSETMMTKTPARASRKGAIGVHFPVPPEGRWEALPALEAFLFDDRRRLIGRAPVNSGVVDIDVTTGATRTIRAVIGPMGMTPEAAYANASLPAVTCNAHGLDRIEMTPGWWNTFLEGQSIRFYGRVEKAFGEHALPLAGGTVEIYAVDPFAWIHSRPIHEIEAFRDDLLRIFQGGINGNPGYYKGIGAFAGGVTPGIPGAEPTTGHNPFPGNYSGYTGTGTGYANGFGASVPVTTGTTVAGGNGFAYANPAAYSTAPIFHENPVTPPFHPGILAGLQGNALRNFLAANRSWLRPWFSMCLPCGWYRIEALGEIGIQPDGTFSGFAGWCQPGQARPDMYFRVRQAFQGATRYLYRPPISNNTWWNYAGQEVVLRVEDPNTVCAPLPGVAVDNQVIFTGVGFDQPTGENGDSGLVQEGEYTGLYRRFDGRYAPYGGTLHLMLDMDPAGIRTAGAVYYRFSFRKGDYDDPTGNWIPIQTPVHRRYRTIREVDGKTVTTCPAVSLVPTMDELPSNLVGEEGIFKIPEADRDYVVIRPEDRAYAIWDTTAIQEPGTPDSEYSGIYTIRLEIFDEGGNEITESLPVFRMTHATTGVPYTNTTEELFQPFFFLHVDNRPVCARIQNVVQTGVQGTGPGCGFLIADPENRVNVNIQAYQPAGFIDTWRYTVRRGATDPPIYTYTGHENAGCPGTWYTAPDGVGSGQTVTAFLNGQPTETEIGNRCGSFQVRLEVTSLVRNGYGPIQACYAADTACFAILERGITTAIEVENPTG